jgi:glycerophosphoryl diester phosphodiesterase
MQILSHRGYWKSNEQKNTMQAFRESIARGFGFETDIRDFLGKVVVTHDPANESSLSVSTMFEGCLQSNKSLPIALNVKSDGLQALLQPLLQRAGLQDFFVFDMAVPDALHWLRCGIPTFTRQSEYEREPAFYDLADGVWLDAFHHDWWDSQTIAKHLDQNKKVCLVSPELHGRDPRSAWEAIISTTFLGDPRFYICTDFPDELKLMAGL